MLPKYLRLPSKNIRLALSTYRKFRTSEGVTIRYLQSSNPDFCIIIKKNIKGSVIRNRLKRIWRDAYTYMTKSTENSNINHLSIIVLVDSIAIKDMNAAIEVMKCFIKNY